jgi:hypothetical protein
MPLRSTKAGAWESAVTTLFVVNAFDSFVPIPTNRWVEGCPRPQNLSAKGRAVTPRRLCIKSESMAICCLRLARGKVNEWRGGASVPFAVVTWSASMKS